MNDPRRPPPVTRLGPPTGTAPIIEDFARAILRATPQLWVTLALVLTNVAVFAVQVVGFGISPMMPDSMDLLRWGAAYGPRVVHGEPWRLLTSMFLHAGLFHIGSNMYVLWLGGRLTERMFGNAAYLMLYLVSGLAAALAAVAFGHAGPLVGASGAVFGIFGALGGYLLMQRKSIPPDFLRSMRGQLVQFVLLNAVISLAIPQISGWAHGGGFVVGFVLGALVSRPPTPDGVRGRGLRALIVGTAALLLLSLTLVPLRAHFPEDPGAIGSPFQRRADPADSLRDVVGN